MWIIHIMYIVYYENKQTFYKSNQTRYHPRRQTSAAGSTSGRCWRSNIYNLFVGIAVSPVRPVYASLPPPHPWGEKSRLHRQHSKLHFLSVQYGDQNEGITPTAASTLIWCLVIHRDGSRAHAHALADRYSFVEICQAGNYEFGRRICKNRPSISRLTKPTIHQILIEIPNVNIGIQNSQFVNVLNCNKWQLYTNEFLWSSNGGSFCNWIYWIYER